MCDLVETNDDEAPDPETGDDEAPPGSSTDGIGVPSAEPDALLPSTPKSQIPSCGNIATARLVVARKWFGPWN